MKTKESLLEQSRVARKASWTLDRKAKAKRAQADLADKAAQPAGHLHAEKLRAQAARLDADSVAKIREGNALFLEAEKL